MSRARRGKTWEDGTVHAVETGVILKTMKRDAKTIRQAVGAFVKTVTKRTKPKDDSHLTRELDQLERRIKTTVGLLADPTFEGLDDIRSVLAELKRKRDAVKRRLTKKAPADKALLSASEMRAWAEDQLLKQDELATRTEVDLADRQLVESYVQRIEINPDDKTGVVVLHADLESVLLSTRVVGGDHGSNHGSS